MTLFEECILALGNDNEALCATETKNVFSDMCNLFPMTKWGRIDWENVCGQFEQVSKKDILTQLNRVYHDIDTRVYILWDEVSLPTIRTDLNKVINAIDDVTAVSFNTWIFCPSANYLIEFYHENEIRVGWTNV